jgi:hypothetical protein
MSSQFLSHFIYMEMELSVGTAPSYPAKRVLRLVVPKKPLGNYYCCGSANALCGKFDRSAPRLCFAESGMFSRVSFSSCLTSASDNAHAASASVA